MSSARDTIKKKFEQRQKLLKENILLLRIPDSKKEPLLQEAKKIHDLILAYNRQNYAEINESFERLENKIYEITKPKQAAQASKIKLSSAASEVKNQSFEDTSRWQTNSAAIPAAEEPSASGLLGGCLRFFWCIADIEEEKHSHHHSTTHRRK